MIGKYLAWTVILLNTAVGLGYLIAGDYKRAVYWGAAAVLNLSVTL